MWKKSELQHRHCSLIRAIPTVFLILACLCSCKPKELSPIDRYGFYLGTLDAREDSYLAPSYEIDGVSYTPYANANNDKFQYEAHISDISYSNECTFLGVMDLYDVDKTKASAYEWQDSFLVACDFSSKRIERICHLPRKLGSLFGIFDDIVFADFGAVDCKSGAIITDKRILAACEDSFIYLEDNRVVQKEMRTEKVTILEDNVTSSLPRSYFLLDGIGYSFNKETGIAKGTDGNQINVPGHLIIPDRGVKNARFMSVEVGADNISSYEIRPEGPALIDSLTTGERISNIYYISERQSFTVIEYMTVDRELHFASIENDTGRFYKAQIDNLTLWWPFFKFGGNVIGYVMYPLSASESDDMRNRLIWYEEETEDWKNCGSVSEKLASRAIDLRARPLW